MLTCLSSMSQVSQIERRIYKKKLLIAFMCLKMMALEWPIYADAAGTGSYEKIFNDVFADLWINLTNYESDFNLHFHSWIDLSVLTFDSIFLHKKKSQGVEPSWFNTFREPRYNSSHNNALIVTDLFELIQNSIRSLNRQMASPSRSQIECIYLVFEVKTEWKLLWITLRN